MSMLIFAASVAVGLAGPTQGSHFDSHGWQSGHNGHHSGDNGYHSGDSGHHSGDNGHHSGHTGWQSGDDGKGSSPSQVPLTDGLPFLAIAGTAYGVYALAKYRNKSKDK